MQLSPLSAVASAGGPFATVYLDASRDTEDAARLIEGRWRALRGSLGEQGADDDTLTALDAAVGSHVGTPGRHGQVVVAAGGQVLLDEELWSPPRTELARWAPLPHLMPYVAQRAEVVPHVVIVADRTGADVTVYGPAQPQEHHVKGEDFPVHKAGAGGWSQRRWQDSVENLWESNAAQTAELVDRLVPSTGARLVVVAGDVRAATFIEEKVRQFTGVTAVRVEEGSRAAGADDGPLRERVATLVAEAAAADMMAIIEEYREQHGTHRRAVDGWQASIDAVRRAQVDTLLLVDDPSSTATLWFADDPLTIGTSAQELRDLGVQDPRQDRADAVLVRALAAEDAALVTVPRAELDLADGLGAVLRYADAATPS